MGLKGMAKDYYAILGVSKLADQKEIKSAYRKLARKFHPDVNPGDRNAEARFKEVQEAYDVLGEADKRKLYDQYGDRWEQVQKFGAAAAGGGMGDFGDFGQVDIGGDFESIFQQIFGGMGGARQSRGYRIHFEEPGAAERAREEMRMAQPRDVEKSIEVTLEEVDSGTKRKLVYQTYEAIQTTEGRIENIPKQRDVMVSVPAGIADGKKLRVSGMGIKGLRGRAGDLYVTIHWAKHPQFRPAGGNLEVDVDVPYTVAALGGEITVPTLRKPLKMRIPAGTQSGQVFRLANQGIARISGGRSDLMARIRITVPKSVGAEERALLEKLSKLAEVKA